MVHWKDNEEDDEATLTTGRTDTLSALRNNLMTGEMSIEEATRKRILKYSWASKQGRTQYVASSCCQLMCKRKKQYSLPSAAVGSDSEYGPILNARCRLLNTITCSIYWSLFLIVFLAFVHISLEKWPPTLWTDVASVWSMESKCSLMYSKCRFGDGSFHVTLISYIDRA